ncbi:AT hook containing transcription factor 1, partial [Caligus rogercresseyi]
IDVQSNERISSETFPSEITSLDSLGPDQVVVGLDSGIVSVLDIKISKRIKSISFPDRISSLAVIQDSAHRSLAEELMFFKGILAVGTQNGDLYLLDLALDKAHACRGEMGQGGPGGHHPLGPYFISPGVTTELADLRHSQPSHLCIHLNQDNTTKGGLVISSLAHIPQLGAVAVGYNSGSWKLVNLNRLHTEFTFSPPPLSSEPLLPCVGFAFQEPENDPRNHSYLWVMWSQNDIDTEEDKKALNTFASIELYALNYENKDEVDQYGVLYSGLTSCSKSFGFTLSGDPEDTRR